MEDEYTRGEQTHGGGEDVRRRMSDYVKSRVSDRVVLTGVKLRKTATALKKTGDCFNEEEQHLIGEYVTGAADRIERLSSYLQDTPLDRIREDARDFSLKNPWVFMGACLSTGIVLGRMVKASQAPRE